MPAATTAMTRFSSRAHMRFGIKDCGLLGRLRPDHATRPPSDAIIPLGGAVMTYRYLATSVAGFVQQLAVAYVARGYYFYVTGRIPVGKDPLAVDKKLLDQYEIPMSKWVRAGRKKQGMASVQYLRWGRFFVLIASHGRHPFFESEAANVRDVREHPIYVEGYSVSCRRGRDGTRFHVSVRIAREVYHAVKRTLNEDAVRCTAERLAQRLHMLRWEPYAPVRVQYFGLWRAINRRRKLAGMPLLPKDVLRLRRRPIRPFD